MKTDVVIGVKAGGQVEAEIGSQVPLAAVGHRGVAVENEEHPRPQWRNWKRSCTQRKKSLVLGKRRRFSWQDGRRFGNGRIRRRRFSAVEGLGRRFDIGIRRPHGGRHFGRRRDGRR